MLDRQEVSADVGLTIRDVIVRWTPYTMNDPDVDRTGFHFGLVPSANRWDGWRAGQRSWHVLLAKMAQALENHRREYGDLQITVEDVTATLSEPLTATRARLTEKIMKALATMAGDSEA